MRKRILRYCRAVEQLLADPPKDIDWNAVKNAHLQQIAFFQHERLIHLIVTMTFAVLTLLSAGFAILTEKPFMLLLTMALLILLIPYIAHYYLLENKVQSMYVQYDRMLEIAENVTI